MRWLRRVGHWFEERLDLGQSLMPMLRHPVPRGLGWWYVFGSATFTLFIVQIVTGTFLALVYVPSAAEAYDSLLYLNQGVTLGWFLRAVHFWSASGMLVMLALHMAQVFLWGAYKYPRELTWLVGVVLLVLTLGLAFTGQVLRWDQDAYWGLGIGVSMMGRIPVIGPGIVHLIMGGTVINGDTLSRFFTLHVFWLPGLLIAFLVVHLYLVVKQGISTMPSANEPVIRETYHAEYEKQLAEGEPFFPNDFNKDVIIASLTVLVVMLLAAIYGPEGPGGVPDPRRIHTEPRPDWEFRWLFALLALSPLQMESFLMLGLPPLLILVLLLVPFVAGRGQRAPWKRPVAVLAVVLIFLSFGVLTWLGYQAPWSPRMHAWSRDPVPERFIKKDPKQKERPEVEVFPGPVRLKNARLREIQGAAVFQNKSCRNCHALEGVGGRRGPDLTDVATRLTHDELVRQVLQGGGNMPAYGKQLKPAEVEALVAFLQTLHPSGEQPAKPTGVVRGDKGTK